MKHFKNQSGHAYRQSGKATIWIIIIIIAAGAIWLFAGNRGSTPDALENDRTTTATDATGLDNDNENVTEGVILPNEEGDNTLPPATDGNGRTFPPVPSGAEGESTGEGTSGTFQSVEHSITYGDNGFSPSSLTINVGDTVVFTNESGKGMWVASALHPTHNVHPEFDDKKSVPPDGKYTFTFENPGDYPYHNHVGANHTGRITVQ